MLSKAIEFLWYLFGKVPKYSVEKKINTSGFGPKYLYVVTDTRRPCVILEGTRYSVKHFLSTNEPFNPWLFKTDNF